MARLPIPGSDDGRWGQILNDFLAVAHKTDGSIRDGQITKQSLGLENVDNTGDANKPISAATQTALDSKLNTNALDAQTKQHIEDTESETSQALRSTFATVADVSSASYSVGKNIAFLGDSITNGSSASSANYAFVTSVGRIAGTEIASPLRYGYPGERSDHLLNDRIDGVLAAKPGALVVMCGTNDVAVHSVAQFISNHAAMRAKAVAAGVPYFVCLVPPRGSTASETTRDTITSYNLALSRWAYENGVPCADTFGALVDPSEGYMRAEFDSGDNTHPNNSGHNAIALAIAKVIAENTKRAPWPVMTKGYGLLPNPLNDSGVGSWSAIAGVPSASYDAPVEGDDLTAGNWYRMGKDNTGSGSTFTAVRAQTVDASKINAGDELVVYFKVKRIDTVGETGVKVQWMRGSSATSIPLDGLRNNAPYSGFISSYTVQQADIDSGPLRLGLAVTIGAGNHGSAYIGQLDVFNLTTRQLTNYY